MSRFVFRFRHVAVVFCTLGLIAGGATVGTSAAHAETSWSDILKPLVKEVLLPGASMGMKKLMEHNEKKHGVVAKAAAESTATASTGSSSTAGSTGSNSWTEFASPQEPMPDNGSSFTLPDEPTTASASTSADQHYTASIAAPPPPPPPVATP